MANLTDADKVIRNDVGKTIASKLDDIANAIVAQGGGAHSLGQLSDVDIDTTTLSEGQSIVYNETTQKFENGEVSTVAALDDLTDVSISSPAAGDSLRNDGNGNWINEPTKIVMTQAEWNAIADKQAWRNAHKNTDLILSDAPNLNATARGISYNGGADTVYDKVEEINTNLTDMKIKRIQCGTVNMDSTSKAVTLTGFTSTPYISVTCLAYYKEVYITGQSSAGFTINTNSTGTFIQYIAVEYAT